MNAPEKRQSLSSMLGGIAGGVGGWALSHYTGAALWVPGAVAVVVFVVFKKTNFKPEHFAGAIAVTSGHLAWFVAGSALLGDWSAAIFDIVVMSTLLSWLWSKPERRPALILGAYQLIVLMLNLLGLAQVAVGSSEHRALTVHILFRFLSIGALVAGVLKLRRAKTPSPAEEPHA